MMKKILCFLLAVAAFLVSPTAFAQATCVSFSSDLAFGAQGSDVTKLQTFLKEQGFFSATMVPHYGNATLAAVRAFQQDNAIRATGIVGPLTREAIRRVSCSGEASGTSTSGTSGSTNTPTNTKTDKFEVSGWMPYWRGATSTRDVLPHLDLVTEVNPFVYSMKTNGEIVDNGPMDQEPWLSFVAAAKAKGVRVIPTIMWSNPDAMHAILRNATLRVELEDRIAKLVKDNGYDGIDIDFEGKHADEKDYFSLFLKGLYQRMGNKWVMCSIESRTPLDSRYYGTDAPPDATIYANDFKEINKYCDRVRVMAYDQQGIDLELSARAASSSELYAPVGDPFWVRKVINLMAKDIKKSKLVIGVPTYGYEYEVTAYAGNQYTYDIMWTFNPGYAWPIAAQYGITPVRNAAGELHFTYNPATPGFSSPTTLNYNPAMLAATAANTIANSNNTNAKFRLLDWPDAQSIAGKAELAMDLGVRGIAIFKFDGGQDPNMWKVLEGVKQ